jgi:hypothetical protein
MTQIQQEGSDSRHEFGLVRVKRRPISERRLRANRANAKRSTGPRTEAGKAASRWNALKHAIRSSSPDLPLTTTGPDLRSLRLNGSTGADILDTDSVLQEINRIWDKLARVVAFESVCAQKADGLVRNAQLICRYETMLTRQLHARIHECAHCKE